MTANPIGWLAVGYDGPIMVSTGLLFDTEAEAIRAVAKLNAMAGEWCLDTRYRLTPVAMEGQP